ncbi:MAG: helix-turn-helix transcriptional regulator [bacterium]|nr:helix-turn-helix transcriptional regulator [bacterium]
MKNNLTIPAENFLADITLQERAFIDQEKRYYKIVVALRKKREKLGLTQTKLAQISQLPRTTITRVESGSRNATLQTLMTMAEAMGSTFEVRLK